MSDYILYDPKKGYIFKTLFGKEKNKDLLISLLNSILRGNPVIKDLTKWRDFGTYCFTVLRPI